MTENFHINSLVVNMEKVLIKNNFTKNKFCTNFSLLIILKWKLEKEDCTV